ncbi:S8 family peptidase [Bacillus sp. J33]|uniref:S8 family peptidase n=1 Tax=Bacillus sp. J33 TaxID=935836 RepID=UPI0004BA93C3|nr:S8 family peptidase [Bacillus sp. J33]
MDQKIDYVISNFLNQKDIKENLDVVIVLNDDCMTVDVSQLCTLQKADRPEHHLKEIKQITGSFCADTLRQLKNHSDVKHIHHDYSVRINLNTATAAIGANIANNSYGLRGRGITVSVIDTGVYRHYDLTSPSNRIIGFRDFVNGQTVPYDDNGHGTHVAGAIAGNGAASSKQYSGVAPEANIVGVKVLDSQGNGSLSNVVAGINWSMANRSTYGIRVINLSLGATPSTSYVNDPLAQACEKAWKSGIVVVAAAGNSGPQGTIDTPGFDPIILTIGAANDRNTIPIQDDIPGNYTSSKPTIDGFIKPDIAVPGTNITSLMSPNSTLANQLPQNRVGAHYLTLTGTSMATGVASGIVALLLQASPPYTPDLVKVRLIEASRYFAPDFAGYSILTTLFNMNRHYNTL